MEWSAGVPDVTGVPSMVTVAVASWLAGVKVIELTVFETVDARIL